jgi:dTDP-4-dehydrorhamnose reductase
MSIRKILVTGANGQVGKELRRLSSANPNVLFLFLSREDLAIHHYDLVRNFFRSFAPDACINCAAYTAVDKAESDQEMARIVNAESVGVLAAVCREHGTRFVHISTDYVFDGTGTRPYTETDETSPVNVYGLTKREGEQLALAHNPESVIVRTSWVYSVFGKNFVKTMKKLMSERESISVVADQWGSPTHARDLADCLLRIAMSDRWVPGIFHYSNEGDITWFEFANAIRELTGSACVVNPISTADYPTPAKRPMYSVMDKSKIASTYGIRLVPWKDSLSDCLTLLKEEKG